MILYRFHFACMAADIASPFLSSLTLFIILLLIPNPTIADTKHSFPPVTFRDGAMKRNAMEFTSRKHGVGKSKTESSTHKSLSVATNGIHVPSPGRRSGRFQTSRSSPLLPWQENIFDAEHEVPSGPNPISNR
ncbi:hypothetical protein I3842_10G107200 [Carya illinoinensis]|uniref:Uncharacterized protein n=1 Tax=Carya illinoinensis TaxID=32201 RepID=A0A922DWX7_CARIL|nr:hypothetical protein I3842_10G107200 [Carya illinoinensis]